MLNAATATELATWCAAVDEVHTVPMTGSDAEVEAALAAIPADWDVVLDNPRRAHGPHVTAVPGFGRYYDASDRHLRARTIRRPVGLHPTQPTPAPPGYVPHQRLRIELPEDASRRADALLDEARAGTRTGPRIALLPAGSSERSLYPSVTSWAAVAQALLARWPGATFCLVGNLRADERTSSRFSAAELDRLRVACPAVVDRFDVPLLDQLAAVAACDVLVSPHSGFGMAGLAVGTPWLTISGGRWPEYFHNGVPFRSVLPDRERFGTPTLFAPPPVLDQDIDGEGPRALAMSHAHPRRPRRDRRRGRGADRGSAALSGRVEHLGGDTSSIFSIDHVHRRYV